LSQDCKERVRRDYKGWWDFSFGIAGKNLFNCLKNQCNAHGSAFAFGISVFN